MAERRTDFPTQPERVTTTSGRPFRPGGAYVAYLMERSMRVEANPALEVAAFHARAADVPLVVFHPLVQDPRAPRDTWRALWHRLHGLRDVARSLDARGVALHLVASTARETALAASSEACCLVLDAGYLRHERAWRNEVVAASPVRTFVVEGEVVVPTGVATDKREYAARTLRPKIWKHVERFLDLPTHVPTRPSDVGAATLPSLPTVTVDRLDDWAADADVDRSVPPVVTVTSGRQAALDAFEAFLERSFGVYASHRNQPQTDDVSRSSVPLKFGHLSPVEIVRRAREVAPDAPSLESFLEETIVRRELAINFVVHSPDDYDAYRTLPEWARTTLENHRSDPRTHLYDDDAFEEGRTHDPYWNAAMQEMRETGYMHNYMRMYWGKKIVEWSESPEAAFERALRLNDRWFLDGREPNGYCGVAWCFGLHDRPWTERSVFGTVRYMNAAGLERKADPQAYVRKVRGAAEREHAARRAANLGGAGG